MLFDTKLDFQGHLKTILNKVNQVVDLLRKFHNSLPGLPLFTIYKSFLTMRISYKIRHPMLISPKIRIYQIKLSSSYNGLYKKDIYRGTL